MKWGNSLGLRIPQAMAREAAIGYGSELELSLEDKALVLRPVPASGQLAELLDAITDENLHGEEDSGPPSGREVW